MVYLILVILLIFIIVLVSVFLLKNIDTKNKNINDKNKEIALLSRKIQKYKRIFPILNNEEHSYRQKIDSLKSKGLLGEFLVERNLENISVRYDSVLFNDLYLALNENIMQIDHILIFRNCVFIIETKNWSINTYGNINSTSWFQFHGNNKKSINSPIKQNYSHLKLVVSILKNNKDININELYFYNLVVFVQNNLKLTNDFYSKNNIYFKALNFYQLDNYINTVLRETTLLSKDYCAEISISILKSNEFKNISLHSKRVSY